MYRIHKLFDSKIDNKGYSFIELLIVIAILAVISGIAIPQVNGVIVNSKKNTDLMNATTIATAVTRAIIDQKIVIPQQSGGIVFKELGEIESEEKQSFEGVEVTIQNLVEMGYLSTVPKVKYIEGEFKVKVDKNGKTTVLIETSTNNYIVYPEMDEFYAQ